MSWQQISVKPDDGQLCVVFDPEHETLKVWPAQYSAENDCFYAGTAGLVGWFEYKEVTQWMPLPAPPNN